MDDYANGHHLQGERIFYGTRQRHHDAIHEEADSDAIESTRDYGVLQKERDPAARRKVDSGVRKCDEKMTEKAEQRRWKAALEGPRPQYAGGDSLQQAHRRTPEITVDDESGGNVHSAARESGPQIASSGLEFCSEDIAGVVFMVFSMPTNVGATKTLG
jgi:hypothetical protein